LPVDEGESVQRIAAHLLHAPVGAMGDVAVEIFRQAAAETMRDGAAAAAVPLLRRALDESPRSPERDLTLREAR
jgi:hypothetical protein